MLPFGTPLIEDMNKNEPGSFITPVIQGNNSGPGLLRGGIRFGEAGILPREPVRIGSFGRNVGPSRSVRALLPVEAGNRLTQER